MRVTLRRLADDQRRTTFLVTTGLDTAPRSPTTDHWPLVTDS